MTWFLDRMNDAREVLTDLLPDTGEQFSGAVREAHIRGDKWDTNAKARTDLTDDMIEKLGGIDIVTERYRRENPFSLLNNLKLGLPFGMSPGPWSKETRNPRMDPEWVLNAAKDLIDKEPELWGDLPRDMVGFNTALSARLEAERSELEEMMGRGDAPWTQFGGQMAGSLDALDVATMPLGGAPRAGAWNFAKWMMAEGLLGAATAVPGQVKEQEQAQRLGFEAGDFWTNVATEGVFGAGLAGVLGGGGKALQYVFDRKRGEGLLADAAGEDPFAMEAQTDLAEAAMRRGEPPPPPPLLKPDLNIPSAEDPAVQNVLTLISRIEAPKGFDQVSDFTVVAPPRPLTRMTVDQVLAWQSTNARAGAESTSAGGYQIIQGTLSGLKDSMGLKGDELFDEVMQRRMAVTLMEGRGLDDWRAGRLSNEEFANSLAEEWAALPLTTGPRAGQSYYKGDGLNNAQVAVGQTPDGSVYGATETMRSADDVIVAIETEGKTRDKPVSEEFLLDLRTAVAPLGDDVGVSIVSGGQDAAGTAGGKRTGSDRHDVDHTGHAHTADVVLTRNGTPVLPGEDPELYERFLYEAAKVYPGIGHYDWGVHVGGGSVASWGPDTTGKTLDPRFGAAIDAGRKGSKPRKGEARVGGDTFLGVLGGERVSDELFGPSRAGSGSGGASRGGNSQGSAGRVSFEEMAGELTTPAGTKFPVRYRVVDASQLRRATGDLQPRDRTRAGSDDQIAKIARDLDPVRLMPGAESDRGAPVIGPDMIVESGNGRVLGITRAAELHPEKYQAYVQSIRDEGFDVPSGMKTPVLVAERTNQIGFEERVQLVRESNTPAIALMSPIEQAKFDADFMSQRAFDAYRPDATIRSPQNAAFVRRVFAGITPEVRGALMKKDGTLSPEGDRRLRAALFARAFDADELLNLALEADDRAVTNLIRMLEDLAPNWAAFRAMVDGGFVSPEFDITDGLMEAVRIIVKARTENRQGQSVIGMIRDRLAQGDMFGDADPMTEALIDVFYKGERARPAEEAGGILQRYAAQVARHGRDDTPGIEDDLTPLRAIRDATGREEKGAPDEAMPARMAEPPEAVVDYSGVDATPFDDGAVAPALVAAADETIAAFAAAPARTDDLASVLGDDVENFVENLADAQPFKTFDDAYRHATVAQARLSEAGKRIADLPGVEFKDPGLKKRADAEEKVTRKGYDGPQGLTDISRGGFTIEKIDQAEQIVAQLAQDFDVVDEGWKRADSGYIDRKIILRHPDGTLSEVQIWTPAVLKSKDVETPFYNARRELPKGDPLRDTLRAKSKEIYDAAAGDSFASINFNAVGISRSPNFLPKRSTMYSGSDVPLDVRSTSSASTSTQSAPGRSLAKAKSFPPGASAKTAGRASQLRNDSFMDDASVADVSNTSRMGADPAPVKAGDAKAHPIIEYTDADGTTRTTAEVVARMNDLEGLENSLRSCQLKGTPQ